MVRVVIIGLDGATWDLIKPWADAGELPTFKKLMKNGTWGTLESTIPPITCPAWVSMLTGKNPGKLGLYYFRQPDWNTMQMKNVKINWDEYLPLWKILNLEGLKTNIINTPTVTPFPNGYKGVYIQCPIMGSENEEIFAYPRFVRKKLKEISYERVVPNPEVIGEDEYLKRVHNLVRKKTKVALYLFENTNWNLFFFTIFYTDQIKHFFWHYMDPKHPRHKPNNKYKNAILEFYKFIDKILSEFISRLSEEDILLLVSDHGHGGMYKEVNYNIYFEQLGLLKFRKKLITNTGKLKFYKILSKIYSIKLVKKITEKISILNRAKNKLSEDSKYIRSKLDVIAWDNTVAYNPTVNTIFINLKGREKYGIIEKNEYEKIREEICKILKQLKDPETNQPVIGKIWKKEEIYSGRYFEKMPDLVVEPINETFYINYGFDNLWKFKLFSDPTPLTYSTHTRRGIFLAYGPGIKKGYEIKNAKIYDIAPTILYIFDLPIPNDMDGKVLMEIFEDDSEFAKRKSKYVDPSYYEKKQENEKLKKAIKNLKLKEKI